MDSALVSTVRRLVNLVLVLGSLAVLSAPLIGLALVALVGGGTLAVGWLVAAQLAFVVALANVVSSLFKWSESGRLRDPWSVLLTGVTGVLSAAALGLLWTQFDDSGGWAPMIAGAGALVGIVGCGVVVVASTGASGTGLGRRVFGPAGILNLDPTREHRYVVARGQVLDILIHRGQVPINQQRRDELVRMALGAWRTVS
ncbi:hypothetical protein KUV85_07890 [Nocardioides panacisoli]|uniref:hypothetical protein n=1 Tax=Nocardioides panacisoli TaxID=627624 RepID=UPI001C637E69|nr:hypothetical protein [Nocardioides panacisoli]QYJ05586.1 hypothetical protein KUV85_07890 [Nocardioides panacisoli]